MCCITSKSSQLWKKTEGRKLTSPSKRATSGMNILRLGSTKRVDGVREKDKLLDGADMKAALLDKKANGAGKLYDDDKNGKKKVEKTESAVVLNHPGFGRVPKASEREQVAAGWPTWLSSVAGEAINGWIPRNANSFERFHKIGQGTYSNVYKARDEIHQKIVALKRVRFDNLDPESVKFMAREILVLRRLDHPNVIKLEGLITSKTSRSLYLVFEYMEHDLTGLASGPGIKFSEPQVKCYMQQLLIGLDHCHSRGVLHRDIKGSNLLIDNSGILKIADFGLATFYDPHHSIQMTSRVVTLWYRPPELLLGASRYGVAVDLWSTGCILGELYSGRPILRGKTEVEQLHKIFKLCGSPSEDYWLKLRLRHSTAFRPPRHYKHHVAETFKEYPSAAVKLIETLLSVDPVHRGTAATALKNEFFSSEPRPCDPSSLPKYPPSKEIDSKSQDEAKRRQGGRQEKEARALASLKDNAESRISMQKGNHKSRSGLLNPHRESVSGFLVFPRKQSDVEEIENYFAGTLIKRPSHSGSFSGGQKEKPVPLRSKTTILVQNHFESINGSESGRRHDKKRLSQRINLSQTENGTEKLIQDGHGLRGKNISVSGPLLLSSDNMDQMLKECDRKIQEYSRRTQIDKSKGEKVHAQRW